MLWVGFSERHERSGLCFAAWVEGRTLPQKVWKEAQGTVEMWTLHSGYVSDPESSKRNVSGTHGCARP